MLETLSFRKQVSENNKANDWILKKCIINVGVQTYRFEHGSVHVFSE